jgi:putative transposase
VEVVTLFGLVRYHALFVIDIATRTVANTGIGRGPGGQWMARMARSLVDAEDGFLLRKRYVLTDRDPLYTEAFRGILKNAGAKPLRLPARNPNLHSYADRFALSIESECLDRMGPLGEGHLRRAIAEYMAHYHRERHHQGLGNALIDGEPLATTGDGAVVCRERLGGLLNFYCRNVDPQERIQ